MKNSIIFFSVILSFFLFNSSFAQEINKGVYRTSGSIALSFSNHEETYYKESGADFQAGGSLNYLLTDNLELGGILSYYYMKHTIEYSSGSGFPSYKDTDYFSGLNIGPSIRVYITSQGIIPFIEASARYTFTGRQGFRKNEQAIYEGAVGFDYFISGGLALEPFISYTHLVYEENSLNTFSLGASLNYFIL